MPALMENFLILVHRLARHLNAQLLHEPSIVGSVAAEMESAYKTSSV